MHPGFRPNTQIDIMFEFYINIFEKYTFLFVAGSWIQKIDIIHLHA